MKTFKNLRYISVRLESQVMNICKYMLFEFQPNNVFHKVKFELNYKIFSKNNTHEITHIRNELENELKKIS
jgi:hypothetical protein